VKAASAKYDTHTEVFGAVVDDVSTNQVNQLYLIKSTKGLANANLESNNQQINVKDDKNCFPFDRGEHVDYFVKINKADLFYCIDKYNKYYDRKSQVLRWQASDSHLHLHKSYLVSSSFKEQIMQNYFTKFAKFVNLYFPFWECWLKQELLKHFLCLSLVGYLIDLFTVCIFAKLGGICKNFLEIQKNFCCKKGHIGGLANANLEAHYFLIMKLKIS